MHKELEQVLEDQTYGWDKKGSDVGQNGVLATVTKDIGDRKHRLILQLKTSEIWVLYKERVFVILVA